jgi:Na+-transporting NADH:ubiquinone oxidoreductase subunit B
MTEFIFEKIKGKKVSEALFITCLLFTLSLPPKTPWWIAMIGIIFGVIFGKEIFGGFGKNIFNPAILSRLFVYLTFPNQMKGFIKSTNFGLTVDSITTATPLKAIKAGESINSIKLLLGLNPGSMGETCIILILIALAYLIITKTASWQIIISTILSAGLLTFILDLLNIPNDFSSINYMFSGSLLFVAVFMATDPVSAPKKIISKWIYGSIIGFSTIIIRTFSFPEGTSFAVLLGNTFAPLLDELFTKKVNT